MQVLDFEIELGDPAQIGQLTVVPLIGTQFGTPAYLTGPEAFEMGLLQVSELDPPQVPFPEPQPIRRVAQSLG